MGSPSSEKLKHYRISLDEYARIEKLLGREPRGVEWALFSALWSEHCSYKSSKVHLREFAKTLTASVLGQQGENAGIVDLGGGERIVFKMESHNHPSFIEPYQGAATGVGGILRDIFTMGARPIASADFLCFGEPGAPRMPRLVDGVVRGIAGYGNAVGVPTVTGETQFDASYNENILVNAMSVGLLGPKDPVAFSGASGQGNAIVYVGAKTGKDGVHGAAMASESFDADSEAKKPNVQIGDPFFEKLLIESCLEVIASGLVVAIQDMGAAGLTSSSFEMSAKGGVGFDLHLDRVPLRDSTMTPEEILLSESQERMLLIAEPKNVAKITATFAHWGLEAVVVGEVRAEKATRLFWKGDLLTEIDPALIVDQAPVYQRNYVAWDFKNRSKPGAGAKIPTESSVAQVMGERLQDSRWGSRKSIYRQYDQRVGGKTARGAESSFALLNLPDSGRALAVSVGCRTAWMKRDAWLGAADAVLFPVFKMAIKGVAPIGVTDCLNFGNPERPEIMSEFVASVQAIRDVCLKLEIPVVSGNVSFYNETQGRNITSTPAVGVVGLRSHLKDIPDDFLRSAGNRVVILRLPVARAEGGKVWSSGDAFNQMNDKVRTWVTGLIELSNHPGVLSNRVVGEGGLAWTLAQMSVRGIGLKSEMGARQMLADELYQFVFEVKAEQIEELKTRALALGFQFESVGETQADKIAIGDWSISSREFEQAREKAWRKSFEVMA